MKNFWIEYDQDWMNYPLAFWVHQGENRKDWKASRFFDPPAPKREINKGYPIYCVEVGGYVFRFSSLEQMDHCINILSRKLLPTTIALSKQRGEGIDPSTHWLSQMPKEVKSWKFREKATRYLKEVFWSLTRN
ncbi:MAG: hypothetical protein ACEPOZ_13075 [Marinifilaceae bacterium]|jgi:hypothetical protein